MREQSQALGNASGTEALAGIVRGELDAGKGERSLLPAVVVDPNVSTRSFVEKTGVLNEGGRRQRRAGWAARLLLHQGASLRVSCAAGHVGVVHLPKQPAALLCCLVDRQVSWWALRQCMHRWHCYDNMARYACLTLTFDGCSTTFRLLNEALAWPQQTALGFVQVTGSCR